MNDEPSTYRLSLHKQKLQSIVAAFLLLPPVVWAESDVDPVYELSPFEVQVEDDRRYRATTTTSGTALDTLIRDLPMGLEVITQEFIEDQQALDFREAVAYSAGVFFESYADRTAATAEMRSGQFGEFGDRSPSGAVNIANPFANAISIRGYPVPNQQRMGFRIGSIVPAFGVVLGGTTDSANIQRQEVVRGPQSLLYGINVLSGIVNIIPRRPATEQRTRTSVTLGSHKLRRATLDNSGPLIPRTLYYRVLGTYTERGHWEDFRDSKENYYAVQLDWFATPKLRLFLEGQYSMRKFYGGGPKFFTDSGGDDSNFLNKFDQRYTFGRDFFDEDIIDDARFFELTEESAILDRSLTLGDGTVFGDVFGMNKLFRKPDKEYDLPDLGPGFRISGPDVRREEEEYSFLALAYFNPFENLNIEVGAYYTYTDIWERQVSMGVFTDSSNSVRPAFDRWDALGTGWAYDSESAWNWETMEMEDPYGYGVGELFVAPQPDFLHRANIVLDRKYASYAWFERPTKSESLQMRGRVAYSLESDWVGDHTAKHVFMVGVSNIKDKVNFVQGGVPNRNYVYSLGPQTQVQAEDGTTRTIRAPGKQDEDPLFFRNIFDYSILRYENQPLAIPGAIGNAPGISSQRAREIIGTSGWRQADLSYRGYYGVYQGQMFDDRLTTVMGIRRDLYQVQNREQLRVLDHGMETDFWQGTGDHRRTPILIGWGDQPYVWRDELPDSMNQAIDAAFEEMWAPNADGTGARPNGTITYAFDRPEQFTSKTFGVSYRITESLSGYYLYSEGVFPNTGQIDGEGKAIPAEQTVNNEIGVKFDLFGGRISGTISAFQIERENAVWWWDHAPAPRQWRQEVGVVSQIGSFNPVAVRDGYVPLVYGVSERYVLEAFERFGLFKNVEEMTATERRNLLRAPTFSPYGAVDHRDWEGPTAAGWARFGIGDFRMEEPEMAAMVDYLRALDLHERFVSGEVDLWDIFPYPGSRGADAPLITPGQTVRVGYAGKLVGSDEPGVDIVAGNPLKLAMDLAIRDETAPDNPMYWVGQTANAGGHNASTMRGANVLYEERGRGVDGQLLFRLLPQSNYHVLVSFSHQKREVTGGGFTLAEGFRVDDFGNQIKDGPNDGRWTTEYDRWVWRVGPENFEDPTNPNSMTGGGIDGLDLSFVPRYSFRVWNKYEFRDTFLEGLEIGGGVRYNGPTTTTLAIGGHNLRENRFMTPDMPGRYVWDTMLAYRSSWRNGVDWRVGFNVYNLTNHRVSQAFAEYIDDFGDPVHRRTRVFHAPRTYRFTVSLDF